MALIFADGFDHYGPSVSRMLDGVYASMEGVTISAAAARTGTYGVSIQAVYNDSGMRRVLPNLRAVVGIGFAFNLNVLPNGDEGLALAQFLSASGATIITLTVRPTGAVQCRRGGRSGVVLAESGPVIRAGSYQHFECEAVFNGVSSAIEVRINGVTVLSDVSLDFGASQCAQVYIGGCYGYPKTGAAAVIMRLDDLYCRDDLDDELDDFVGDQKVYTRMPASDGAEQEWSIAVGTTSYAMLNSIPPDDGAKFLTASEAGKRTSVGISAFPSEIVAISAVYTATRLWKNDAGNAKVAVQVDSEGTETAQPAHPISTAPSWYGNVFTNNPATGAPWTVEEVSALSVIIDREE